MARTVVTVNAKGSHTFTETVFQAGDALNGMSLVNNGSTKLTLKTGAGGTGTVTIKSVKDAFGRLGDLVITLGANKVYETTFIPIMIFNSGGLVDIDIVDDTDLEISASQVSQ